MTTIHPALDATASVTEEDGTRAPVHRRIGRSLAGLGGWLLARFAPGLDGYELTDRDLDDLNLRRWQVDSIRRRDGGRS